MAPAPAVPTPVAPAAPAPQRGVRKPRSEAYSQPARVDGPIPQPQARLDTSGQLSLGARRSDSPPPLVIDQRPMSGGTKSARTEPSKNIVTNPRPPVVAKPMQQRVTAARGPKKAVLEKRAAERIQRMWLRERGPFLERKARLKRETAASVKIQARYRSWRVVRRKRHMAVMTLQRHARGMIVRTRK